MGRNKKNPAVESAAGEDSFTSNAASNTSNGSAAAAPTKKAASEPSTSALIICRNKHWRYISSFHGPWLQLPPEVLESLAHTNYLSPRPHPIDPAVFYDLVKIRKCVDEATNLAVRATSGLTSAALSNSLNAGNGMLGNAAALGIGYGGGGSNAKLSRERKHRMRELATAKLSQAYHLDEIAASVATMQSASTLEDVAQLVLQRNPNDVEAAYVHFFHEKIPSRMMAQCTPLDALNQIIAERPSDGSPLRTRALTRMFKDDFVGSATDLSEALVLARYMNAQHTAGKDQLVLAKSMQEHHGRDWRQDIKIAEQDQPNSLETQLLFHRAGVYFTLAVGYVHDALHGLKEAEQAKAKRDADLAQGIESPPMTAQEEEAHRRRLDCRKQVKTHAKRALRDYMAFLSHFDYTPGITADVAEDFLQRMSNATDSKSNDRKLIDSSSKPSLPASEALVPHRRQRADGNAWPKLPSPEIYQVSDLFAASPPSSLPPYPPVYDSRTKDSIRSQAASAFADSHESITYHPLLTDALHSLLLCHALAQTPPKEIQRHAHNATRLARVCDGYPIFLAARSPARADWIEVLRRTGNWINLSQSWETLCRPAPLPGHGKAMGDRMSKDGDSAAPRHETEAQRHERQKHEAILEALADERVVDEDSFQRAVRARERRFRDDEEAEQRAKQRSASRTPNGGAQSGGSPRPSDSPKENEPAKSSPSTGPAPPKRWAQDDGREYPISTDRAEAISCWVRDAPLTVEGAGGKKGRKRGKAKRTVHKTHDHLEDSVGALSLGDAMEEEEVD